MIVQLCNSIATNDNADCHIAALNNALDYIDEARLKANKQITGRPHFSTCRFST